MSNRILRVQVRDRSLDPAQIELWVSADVAQAAATAELRGRLMGPRCRYAATVEVAYPLRPFARRPEGLSGPAARVVIPEPSLWDPEGPFVYEGAVELWEDGQRCDEAPLRRGLRRILLGPHGLRVNGQTLALRGRSVTACDETEATALRRAGYNLLLAPAETGLWDLADRIGFFVLGRLREPDEAPLVWAEHRPIIRLALAGFWRRRMSAGRASQSAGSAPPAPRSGWNPPIRRPKESVLSPVRPTTRLTAAPSVCRSCFSERDRTRRTCSAGWTDGRGIETASTSRTSPAQSAHPAGFSLAARFHAPAMMVG